MQGKEIKVRHDVKELISKLSFLGDHYDIVRMVDPVAKRVHDLEEGVVSVSKTQCYAF